MQQRGWSWGETLSPPFQRGVDIRDLPVSGEENECLPTTKSLDKIFWGYYIVMMSYLQK